jgi:hypothetical protein
MKNLHRKTFTIVKITSMADNFCQKCRKGISWGNYLCKACGGTGIAGISTKQT